MAGIRIKDLMAWLAVAFLCLSTSVHVQQRDTIPQMIAAGGVGSVAGVPSGPTPSVTDLLRTADVVVRGTIGQPRSYLSEDQREIYTDYPIGNPTFVYQAKMMASSTPGMLPTITVTQHGGTVMVNGTKFTQKETALGPLQPGTQGLFLLQHVGDKYFPCEKYYGAFGIKDGKVTRLAAREDFAAEYDNIAVSDAVDSMMATLRTRVQSPK